MKTIKLLLSIFLIILFAFPSPVFASTPQSESFGNPKDIQITDNQAIFSFEDLGNSAKVLQSPLGETIILFSVPPNWQIVSGSTVELRFDVIVSGIRSESSNQTTNFVTGGNLIVKFNDILIGIVNVNQSGSYVQQFSIPEEAVVSKRQDGRHALTITLDAQLSCNYDQNTNVTIKVDSFFNIFYQQSSPILDLSKLPTPFYQANSIVTGSTLFVIQDNPQPSELQAAMNVISGFGAMINRAYDFKLIHYSELDQLAKAQNNLIFIGFPSSFDVLSEINLKIPVKNGSFEGVPSQSIDDGILQMAASPWNASKVILLVSGNSEEALSKAAYAVSTGNILIFQDPALAYVSNVQFLPMEIPVVEQFTLEDLGYSTETISGVGRSTEEYVFFASKSQLAGIESYIELIYNHAGLREYTGSSFSLYLNGTVFFTKVLSEETEQITSLQIRIPPGFLRYGENILELEVDMLEQSGCEEDSAILNPWFSVSNQSLFFIPSAGENLLSQILLRDFKFFPEIFSTSSDLSELTFVLPPNNFEAWRIAANLSYLIGSTAQPGISNIKVAFGDSVSEEIRKNQSLIIIGKASDLPFIAEINEELPAPFDLSTNTASEKQLLISYRIPQGQNVGYLELIPSPFNNEKSILFISGNTDVGVTLASNTLLQTGLQDQLAGIFAVTNGSQIASGSGNTSFSIVGEGVPGSQQEVANQITEESAPLEITPPFWLIPFVILSIITILVVIFIILRDFILKNQVFKIQETISAPDGEKEDK